jgi:hypothetical protein
MMHLRTLASLFALVLAGCAGGGTAPDPTPMPIKPAVQLSGSEVGLETGTLSTGYNFGDLRDLWVRVALPTLPPVAKVKLVFLNPRGETVMETTVPFSADPNITKMAMPNMDHLATVFRAKKIAGGYALDYPIPVLGSVMTRYPTVGVGTWVVQARVEGMDDLMLSQTFEVTFTR